MEEEEEETKFQSMAILHIKKKIFYDIMNGCENVVLWSVGFQWISCGGMLMIFGPTKGLKILFITFFRFIQTTENELFSLKIFSPFDHFTPKQTQLSIIIFLSSCLISSCI